MRRRVNILSCKRAGLPILPRRLAYGNASVEMDIIESGGVYHIYAPESMRDKLLCTPSRIKAEDARKLLLTNAP
jgi:hypothetical protein